MPMEEVVRAHTMMEKNEQVGKIVLTMEWIVCYEYDIEFGEGRVLHIHYCWNIDPIITEVNRHAIKYMS